MNRSTKLLLGLVIVQIGLFFVTRQSGRTLKAEAPKLLIPEFGNGASGNAVSLSVYEPGETKPSIVATKEDAGWILTSHFGAPASAKPEDIVGKLKKIRVSSPIASSKQRYTQFGVASGDYTKKVVVGTSAGDVELFVGNPSGRNQTALRLANSQDVYAASGIASSDFPVAVASWMKTDYLQINTANIATLSIANKQGKFDLAFDEGNWKVLVDGAIVEPPKRKAVNESELNAIVSSLRRITAKEPADPKTDWSAPDMTIVITMKKPETPTGTEETVESVAAETYILSAIAQPDGDFVLKSDTADRPIVVAAQTLSKAAALSPDNLYAER